MTEEFALQQGFRQGRAVDHHKGAGGPAGIVMQGLGDQGLAGAGLAAQQHGGVGVRHPVDHVEHLLHARGVADDLLDAVAGREFPAELAVFLVQGLLLLVDPLDALHGLGDQPADHGEKAEILLGFAAESAGIHPVDGQGADGVLVGDDGHAQEAALLFALVATGAGAVEEQRLVADLRHEDGLTGGHHLAGDAFAQLVAAASLGLGADAVRHLDLQLAGGRVDDGDGAVVHAHPLGQARDHLFQAVLQVGGRGQVAGDLIETGQVAEFDILLLVNGAGCFHCWSWRCLLTVFPYDGTFPRSWRDGRVV